MPHEMIRQLRERLRIIDQTIRNLEQLRATLTRRRISTTVIILQREINEVDLAIRALQDLRNAQSGTSKVVAGGRARLRVVSRSRRDDHAFHSRPQGRDLRY